MVWFILFSLPYLLSSGQEQILQRVIIFSWIPLGFYAIIFYLNYFVFIDRFLFNKQIVVFVIINILFITVFIWLNSEIKTMFFSEFFHRQSSNTNEGPPKKMFIYVQIISFIVPLVFSIALKTTERWIITETEHKEAANIKLKSELQLLKYQLQPHFFFNSLNNIYSLVDISPERAKQTIHSLSKLIRYLLYETNAEKVSLQKEIDFMVKYIELMKLRFTEKTKINYSFPEVNLNLKIAPLLFISLVENAFKHGVSASEKTQIDFKIEVEDDTVFFFSKNKNFKKTDQDQSGSGIGLENLEKRLELIYKGKHQFTINQNNNYFEVFLSIKTNKN